MKCFAIVRLQLYFYDPEKVTCFELAGSLNEEAQSSLQTWERVGSARSQYPAANLTLTSRTCS
jgi:hypothetical protein